MHTETIEYSHGQVKCVGYLAYDATIKGKRPAVIVSHHWTGQEDIIRDKANQLAAMGYVGFALDMYGNRQRGANNEENNNLMQPFLKDRALLDGRINAAVTEVKKHLMVDADRIGAMGYCFGGLCVLDLARSGTPGVRGVVAIHGLFNPPPSRRAKTISAKVLALHGYDDPLATPDQMKAFCDEMTEAKADWQLHAFGHCVHAFTNPQANDRAHGMQYDPVAEKRSWILLKNFFEEVLG